MDSSNLDPILYVLSGAPMYELASKRHLDRFRRFCVQRSSLPMLFNRAKNPKKLSLPLGDLDNHIMHVSLGPTESVPKQHLDRLARFCTAHPCATHTHRHADHATCDICCNRPHLCYAVCMGCGLQKEQTQLPIRVTYDPLSMSRSRSS